MKAVTRKTSPSALVLSDIKQDLKSLQEVTIEDDGKRLAIRAQCQGTCGKVFQAVGVAVPQTMRQIAG